MHQKIYKLTWYKCTSMSWFLRFEDLKPALFSRFSLKLSNAFKIEDMKTALNLRIQNIYAFMCCEPQK